MHALTESLIINFLRVTSFIFLYTSCKFYLHPWASMEIFSGQSRSRCLGLKLINSFQSRIGFTSQLVTNPSNTHIKKPPYSASFDYWPIQSQRITSFIAKWNLPKNFKGFQSKSRKLGHKSWLMKVVKPNALIMDLEIMNNKMRQRKKGCEDA